MIKFLLTITIIYLIGCLFFIFIGLFYDKDYEDVLATTKDIESKNLYISRKIKRLKPNFRNFLSDNLSGNYGKMLHSYNTNPIKRHEDFINTFSIGDLVKHSDSILQYFDSIAKISPPSKHILYCYPLQLPVYSTEKYIISRPFSESLPDPFTGENKKHNGIDIAAPSGAFAIILPANGDVLSVKDDVFLGKTVKIRHLDGYETFYAHLGSVLVKQGQKLKRGTCIGYAGESGWAISRHLHYELIKNGVSVDPLLYNFNSLYN
ncbi:MAG: M23 family metallopeptidase [Chitinispirillales bacterium]|nr:M23 family metallopeptidase [Chitinispirillales bacterium]